MWERYSMKNWVIIGLIGLTGIHRTNCFADATVKLSNLESKLPLDFANAKAVAVGNDFYVQVLAGPVGGPFTPVPIAGTTTNVFKLDKHGFFDAGIGVIPGVWENGYADFRIRVWRGMPTYDLANVVGLITGVSPAWRQKVGSWDPKTASPATATGPVLEMKAPVYSGYLEPVPPLSTVGIFDSGTR
jgi:hypothetical protein